MTPAKRTLVDYVNTRITRNDSYMLCVQVLLHAGPAGMNVAKIVETAEVLGLVPAVWLKADKKKSRNSQIGEAIRRTDVFVHVGDHRYAIATFPGIEPVPLPKNSDLRALLLNS